MKRIRLKTATYIAILATISIASCTSFKSYHVSVISGDSYHSSYDDTTLTPDNSFILMPYNRFIDPAGIVIRFGNGNLENHSLDCILLPGTKILAVEDRYGVAFIDTDKKTLLSHLDYAGEYRGLMSTYSGIKAEIIENAIHIFWGAANPGTNSSFILDAVWNGSNATIKNSYSFNGVDPSPMALPNDISINNEDGTLYLYVVLNGNSQLTKLRLSDKKEIWTIPTGMAPYGIAVIGSKAYVTNWGGPVPVDTTRETAGIPYAGVYVDPKTGATAMGTVSVIDLKSGKTLNEIEVGLHPNAIIASKDKRHIYIANGNSDNVSVIDAISDKVVETIPVGLSQMTSGFIGDTPNALVLDNEKEILYVSNGMDNAIAVVSLGEKASITGRGMSVVKGFIPTEAYPAGLTLSENTLYVANLEGEGPRVKDLKGYTIHKEEATVSIIEVPDNQTLKDYSVRVENSNMIFRSKLSMRLPRKDVAPRPVPERIGEPSVFKHVVYIIKENKTYDQVLGDITKGDGMNSLCIFGREVTPNQHKIADEYMLMDNYYASGKCSAEGHSWTDAAIVTDYNEKTVRAWFRSYPHILYDAMVYNKKGFIWNNALDHGKSVRIYGEACTLDWKGSLSWDTIYSSYLDGKVADFENLTTISRVKPILCPTYPGFEGAWVPDQIRADAFIKELNEYENMPGDQLPNLLILALPNDHTAGTREGYAKPEAMVADNDLALGRIIEALSKSRFWESTVVFVTEDDSQSGWDHVSAYRTTGFVISPYSHLRKTVHTNYNQTCMVRTIEQILGVPPMNAMDATALPMFECFDANFDKAVYTKENSNIPLGLTNPKVMTLSGQAKEYALLSASDQFNKVDDGDDDLMNHILWFAAKGDTPYPKEMTLPLDEREDDDD
ncbi:MAG TPA: alkaline phosphatase family protein [Bacteroidales bacterium]|mgnify:CR=1 FL=1|nr:alkaline phosphatase family protein [Bacteroidales bacterium]